MPDLVVREWRKEERARLIELYRGLNFYEQEITGDRRTDPDGAVEGFDEMVKNVKERDGRVFVAAVEGKIEGFLGLTFGQMGAYITEDVRPFAYICDLYVSERWRRSGVGTALIAKAEAVARERGFKRIVIGALFGNDMAINAYQKNGFKPYALELTLDLD